MGNPRDLNRMVMLGIRPGYAIDNCTVRINRISRNSKETAAPANSAAIKQANTQPMGLHGANMASLSGYQKEKIV